MPLPAIHARHLSRLLAALAGLFAVVTLLGYALGQPGLVTLRSGLRGMSPVTALALGALAVGVVAVGGGRGRLVRATVAVAGTLAAIVLCSHAFSGGDLFSPWLAARVSDLPAAAIGRTSVATAGAILFVAAALACRRARPQRADACAAVALVISGTALLGYVYGVDDLYALPMFNTMALNTALGLFVLALATHAAVPESGWAALILSTADGAGWRRLLAFAFVPPVAGWALVRLTLAGHMGFGAALALLVVATIVPLVLLILRDARARVALDSERQARMDLQSALAVDLERQLAAKVVELEREVAERARAETVMHHAQRLEAVGRLTGGIAHDFNNLLQALGGNVSLLKRRIPEDDPARRFVDNAGKAVQKGAKLTAQLLTFSRNQRLSIRPVFVRAAMQDAYELIRHSIGPDIALAVDMPGEDDWVQGDSNQLELALVNLAMNSRDAMPDGGMLRIAVRDAEAPANAAPGTPFVAVLVTDTGSGMSADVASRAIEPFFTTKPQGKGTGLGLAQVYGFARQCGGDLQIETAPGRGTTVALVLPRARPEPPPAATSDTAPAADRAPTARSHILLIDDDDSVRSVIAQGLADAGYEVVQASDGLSGLRELESASPAVAVIDFLMPGMNGAEVARRAQARIPGLPIVFVSGYSDTVALDGIAGAVVLRKPFDLDGLRSAVSAALR